MVLRKPNSFIDEWKWYRYIYQSVNINLYVYLIFYGNIWYIMINIKLGYLYEHMNYLI